MPVLARLQYIHKLYINAPVLYDHIHGRLKIEGTNTAPAASTKLSLANDFSANLNAGMQVSRREAGYNFSMKRSILTLDVRYGYGLVNVSRDRERYNRMLNISLQVFRAPPGKNIREKR